MGESTYYCNNRDQIQSIIQQVSSCLSNQSFEDATGSHQSYEIIIQPIARKRRTPTQNNCIHDYCTRLAKDLNNAGYERIVTSEVLSEPLSVPWSKETVKSEVWHRAQLALTEKAHSRDLTTTETQAVYEVISRHMAKSFGITTPWPTWENEGGKYENYEGVA